MKLELGGGTFCKVGYLNLDQTPPADYVHDLNVYPWPLQDDTVTDLYTSHCLEHLVNPGRALVEICRICSVGATVVIKVPDPLSEGVLVHGHLGVLSESTFRNTLQHFTQFWGNPDKILKLNSITRSPDPLWFPRARALEIFKHYSDTEIITYVPRTCHDATFECTVITR